MRFGAGITNIYLLDIEFGRQLFQKRVAGFETFDMSAFWKGDRKDHSLGASERWTGSIGGWIRYPVTFLIRE